MGWVLRLALINPAKNDLYRGMDKYRDAKAYMEATRKVRTAMFWLAC